MFNFIKILVVVLIMFGMMACGSDLPGPDLDITSYPQMSIEEYVEKYAVLYDDQVSFGGDIKIETVLYKEGDYFNSNACQFADCVFYAIRVYEGANITSLDHPIASYHSTEPVYAYINGVLVEIVNPVLYFQFNKQHYYLSEVTKELQNTLEETGLWETVSQYDSFVVYEYSLEAKYIKFISVSLRTDTGTEVNDDLQIITDESSEYEFSFWGY